MPTLSPPQIAAYARGAGFKGADVAIAVAVALAESGGRTDAVNKANSNGSRDYGLWQINSVHKDLLASGTWSDPADNAHMAYRVWKGAGWKAWTTYNTGAYLKGLSRGRNAAANPANTATLTAGHTTDNAKGYKGGTEQRNGFSHNATGLTNPGHGKWRHPWHDYKPGLIPDPPVDYVAGQWTGQMVKWAKAINAGSSQTINPPVYNAAQIRLIKAWLTQFSPAGVTKDALKKASNTQTSQWYANIANGQTGFDAGGAEEVQVPGVDDALSAAKAVAKLVAWLIDPENWVRIAFFVAGGLLVLIAAYQITSGAIPSPVKLAAKVVA